jgi:hypothetical protein
MVRAEFPLLAPLIHDPDAWLAKGLPLKRGRTATLARVEVNGRQLVIKRYNIKGPSMRCRAAGDPAAPGIPGWKGIA